MKRTLLGMAAVAMMFASCSKNEVTGTDNVIPSDASKINLLLSTGNVSRAVDNDLPALESAPNGFAIIGTLANGDKLLTDTYKYDNGGTNKWNWGTESVNGYEWPVETAKYPVKFYGYFPHDLAGIAFDNLKYTPSIGVDMDNQTDYLFVTKEVANKPSNGFTALQFKHILSKIKFNVQTKKDMKVYIQSIRIANVANAGGADYYYDLTATEEVNGKQVQVGKWTTTGAPVGGEVDYAHFTGATGTIREALAIGSDELQSFAIAGDQLNGALMLLPQGGQNYTGVWSESAFKTAVDANHDTWANFIQTQAYKNAMAGARIEVTYRIVGADGKDYIGRTKDVTYKNDQGADVTPNTNEYVLVGYKLDLANLAWTMNNQYTYTISLGTPDASNGTVLDPNYKNDDGGDTNTPIDNPKVNPGDPVSTGKIGFTVSVSEWGNQEGSIK